MKNTKKHIDISRLFIYYVSRTKDVQVSNLIVDGGTAIRSAIAALTEFGCCKEQSYPYNPAYVNHQPPAHCYAEARNYRICQAMNVESDLNEMKACLAEGFPFAFGIQTFNSFATAGSNGGRVPMPQPSYEPQAATHGWHAMLAVGYSDASQCFIVRNSWGENWGDKGYCYIPYGYMCNSVHYMSGLQTHLQNQAPSMGIHDWKQRLFITNNSQELMKKIKQNAINKH
ncbi:hypothetical protein I4U23_020150 [Adineta vaga]|nr:hypothetical protein I4U23_020150 [Adineta vaga]